LTAAGESPTAGGAGSPSDNKPPEGLAERTASDPTATRKPSGWFGGEIVEATWESPRAGKPARLVKADNGVAIADRIAEDGTVVPALGAVVERSVVGWRLTHNW